MTLSDERRWSGYMRKLERDVNGCWLWTGKIKVGARHGGYGMVRVNYRDIRVHRLFYERFVGSIPHGLEVCHRCDVRRCVNPEHLYVGTHADNMADMAARGRRRRTHCPKGHPLTDAPAAADGSRCVICRHDRANRYARRVRGGMAAMLAMSVALIPATGRTEGESVRQGDRGPLVAEVQTILAGMGYSVVVDSQFGPQTAKAVRSWQTSNGLEADAIAGPITLASLRGATRINNARTVGGLGGRGFAPDNLDACAEARFYREQWGLPQRFDALVWRESNCRNDVTSRTGCCVGYLQLHYVNWRDHRTIDGLAACQATWENVRGDTPEAKQRQMCAAKVLFDVVGYQPWRLTA